MALVGATGARVRDWGCEQKVLGSHPLSSSWLCLALEDYQLWISQGGDKQEQFFFALPTCMASRVVMAEGRDQHFEAIQMGSSLGGFGYRNICGDISTL